MWVFLVTSALAGEVFEGRRFVFGDIHAHTGASGDGGSADIGTCIRASDGGSADCGNVADLEDLARDAGMDFLATVDHVTSTAGTTTDEAFEEVFHHVNSLNAPADDFVTLPGAEIFVELPGGVELGHRSLLMFGQPAVLTEVQMADLQPSGSRSNQIAGCEALSVFMEGLEERFGPALLIPHHPGVDKPMATDWSCNDVAWAPVVEAYSEHGSSLDPGSPFDPPWSGWAPEGSVLAALDPEGFGLQLGLVGGTDNHDTHPGDVCRTESVLDNHPYSGGLTGVTLEDGEVFDRLALYRAFRERRTYTTTGPQLPVFFEVTGPGGELHGQMGEVLTVDAGEPIDLELRVPEVYSAMVDSVTVVSSEQTWAMEPSLTGIWRARIVPEDRPHYVLADVRLDGDSWFGLPCEDGGSTAEEHIWTSPIWFEVMGPVDGDGDGYTTADGDCDDTNPFVNPAAAEACRTPDADHDCDGILSQDDSDCVEDTSDPQTEDTGQTGEESNGLGMEDAERRAGKATCSTVGGESKLSWVVGSMLFIAARRRRS